MAKVLDNAFVEVNGNNISTYIRSVSVPQEVAALDATTMGDGTTTHEPGLRGWTVSFTALNSYTAAELDSILSPLVNDRTKFTVKVRPDAGAIGAGNPEWSGTGFISSYEAVGGSVGELVESPVEIVAAGALTRATA